MPLGGAVTLGAIAAGASMFGSKNAANAAKSAASQQQASVNQAQQFAQQAFNQQQQALSPYRQAGQMALSNLMARQYGGNPSQYGAPQAYGTAQPNQGYGQQNMNPGAAGLQNVPGVGFSLSQLSQPPYGGQGYRSMPMAYGTPAQGGQPPVQPQSPAPPDQFMRQPYQMMG